MTNHPTRSRGPIRRLHHELRYRPAMLAGIAGGLLAGVTIEGTVAALNGWLVGWTTGIAVYATVSAWRMAHATPASIRQRAINLDETRDFALAVALLAAIVALCAVLIDLADARVSFTKRIDVGIAISTIAVSWLFIHIVFTQHYAHEYWMERLGLVFPNTREPNFWDFIYFAFVIGMTYQVSDVSVSNTHFRRIIIIHALISFVFNTVILALVISFAAGLAS